MTANGPASPRYVEDAVNIILKVHRTQGPGHILAFFTGQDEIERVCRMLGEALAQQRTESVALGVGGGGVNEVNEWPQELLVVPLFGALSAEAQAEAFYPARRGVRKVCIYSKRSYRIAGYSSNSSVVEFVKWQVLCGVAHVLRQEGEYIVRAVLRLNIYSAMLWADGCHYRQR